MRAAPPRRRIILASMFALAGLVCLLADAKRKPATALQPDKLVYLPWLGRSAIRHHEHVANRLVLRYAPDAEEADKMLVRARLGARVVAEIPKLALEVLRVDRPEELLELAASQRVVESAELDYVAHLSDGQRPLDFSSPPEQPLGFGSSPARALGLGSSAARPLGFGSSPGRALAFGSLAERALGFGSSSGGPWSAFGRRPLDATHTEFLKPNDPLLDHQWHHATINSPVAWGQSRASGFVVAVIDTGVQCEHPDLLGRCVSGYDFVDEDAVAQDDQGHGTHVAGLVAASVNNGLGVAGLAWDAFIMPIRVIGSSGWGRYSDIAQAVVWATDRGAHVINMSIGGPADTAMLASAVDYARRQGVLLVAAVGNGDGSAPQYPAAHEGVIGVTATTPADERARFANYGSYVDFAAPGVDILSTSADGGYVRMTGTSMAAPLVSGLAALLRGQDPILTPQQIERIMADSAVDLGEPGWDRYFGQGRIDAGSALAGADSPLPTPSPEPGSPPVADCVPLQIGETAHGELMGENASVTYCFHGADWVSMRMFGLRGLDPLLRLIEADGRTTIAENDNADGIGANAFLAYRLPPADYVLQATGCCDAPFAVRIEQGRAAGVGDIDKDCDIDLADRERIAMGMGGMLDEDADLDLDGNVTPADLLIWSVNQTRALSCR